MNALNTEMTIDTLINRVQEARDNLGMARLTNPKKLGRGKLQDAMIALEQKLALERQPTRIAPTEGTEMDVDAENDRFDEQMDEKAARDALVDQEEQEATQAAIGKKPEAVGANAKPKAGTIKSLSCELLCEVVSKDEDGRSVGHSYKAILAKILEAHPEASTSLNCLRWYAGKIRVQATGYIGMNLPAKRAREPKPE